MEHGRFSNFSMEHGRFSNFSMKHGRFSNFVEHGPFSNFVGAWSFFEILPINENDQANGRLSFDDDLRSGGLLYCVSQ